LRCRRPIRAGRHAGPHRSAGERQVSTKGKEVPAVYAAPNGPIVADKPCYIPGSTLPYVAGEKATFSVNGQPAKEYTCQKDGTWTALRVLDWRVPTAPIGTGVLTP
jgi:hypothetical protein